VFELLRTEIGLLDLALKRGAFLSEVENTIKRKNMVLNSLILLGIFWCLPAHQYFSEISVHHLLEMIFAENRDDRKR